ncbi:MAG: hypothetical protein AB1485_04865 [Candidatus Thermoplasmatota archaeon]
MRVIKIKYEQIGAKFFPVINIRLIAKNRAITTKAYVDSGATYSIFNAGLARILQVDYKRGKKVYPLGVSGHICAYLCNIKMGIEDVEIPCEVLFSDEIVTKFNIIGRCGIFEKFRVCFDDVERTLYLYPKM